MRGRAITWMFAALNTVEPAILELATARLLEGDKPWSKERLPLVEDRVRDRLKQLSARLGSADWLDGAFSAGDLMMVSVLLRLKSSGILDEYPNLWPPMSPAAKRGPPTSGLSPLNWRFTPASHRPAD
jgi:glutathione S-transferase